MKRVSLREIGKQLGLSHVAVSLALRNDPSIPETTREKVRKAADELGYRPDPALGALNAYRQARRPAHYRATLAWINPYPQSEGQLMTEFFQGGTRRAEQLGFKIEPFWVPSAEDWARLPKVLKSRGIQGLVLTSAPSSLWPAGNSGSRPAWPWLGFPWEEFSAIALGQQVGPMLHFVASNHLQSAALAVSKLTELGYRKIGIVLRSIQDQTTHFCWLAGYLAECARRRIAPLYMIDPEPIGPHLIVGPCFTKHAAQWLLRHRPEAVIAPAKGEIAVMLRETRLEAPGDIAVVTLAKDVNNTPATLAGIEQNFTRIGEAAIEHLVDMIRRNERGMPVSPTRHLIEGTWVDGPSAPPKEPIKPKMDMTPG